MQNRTKLTALALCFAALTSYGQNDDRYLRADSITWKLYQTGEWSQLLKEGNTLVRGHTDFLNLRLRMGYAAFLTGNYSNALKHYQVVLKQDSYNQVARYYAALCQAYLNRDQMASWHASYVFGDHSKINAAFKLSVAEISLESSFKNPGYSLRGNGYFNRLGMAIRLGGKMRLDQSVSLFGQKIYGPTVTAAGQLPYSANQQGEYMARLSYIPVQNLTLWGGYHYLGSSLDNARYTGTVGLLGIRYAAPYVTLQGDANMGTITGDRLRQYNASLTYFPMGNLRLYSITRGSLKDSGKVVISQLIGAGLSSKFWVEASASIGPLDNFIEADGLYVYNSIDPGKWKGGASVLYTLFPKSVLSLTYTYERKEDTSQLIQFNQHSITAGISWKF